MWWLSCIIYALTTDTDLSAHVLGSSTSRLSVTKVANSDPAVGTYVVRSETAHVSAVSGAHPFVYCTQILGFSPNESEGKASCSKVYSTIWWYTGTA